MNNLNSTFQFGIVFRHFWWFLLPFFHSNRELANFKWTCHHTLPTQYELLKHITISILCSQHVLWFQCYSSTVCIKCDVCFLKHTTWGPQFVPQFSTSNHSVPKNYMFSDDACLQDTLCSPKAHSSGFLRSPKHKRYSTVVQINKWYLNRHLLHLLRLFSARLFHSKFCSFGEGSTNTHSTSPTSCTNRHSVKKALSISRYIDHLQHWEKADRETFVSPN